MDEELYEKLLVRLETTRIRIADVIELAMVIIKALNEEKCNTFIRMLSEMITEKDNRRCHDEY